LDHPEAETIFLEDLSGFVIGDLGEFAIKCCPFIERSQAELFNEIRYWLNINLEKALHEVCNRVSRGKQTVIHGSLRMSSCYPVKSTRTNNFSLQFRGREKSVISDPFLDLANLVIDLELGGRDDLSEDFLVTYQSLDSSCGVDIVLLNYFKLVQVMNRYYELVIDDQNLEQDNFSQKCESLLQYASHQI